jgi:uncharacterized phage-like protein YoqJ
VTITLEDIPDVDPSIEAIWKVRAMVVDGRDPVQAALARWKKKYPNDYKAILKVMNFAAQNKRVSNPKYVKKSSNPAHNNAYEMIAYTGIARLMFFYDEREEALIVCTNEFEKCRGNQDAAFQRCVDFRELYERHRINDT